MIENLENQGMEITECQSFKYFILLQKSYNEMISPDIILSHCVMKMRTMHNSIIEISSKEVKMVGNALEYLESESR